MAIDGSFNLHCVLERFLSRCPRLASIPEFDYLLKKGVEVSEEEVVKATGELVLHPKYTIPLVGCFRPIVHKVVGRAVSLLRLVPNLGSNSDDSMMELDEDKFLREDEDLNNAELLHVIDVYARTGKGLHLHELACLAFCRALDMVPFLLRTVLDYFQFAPAPFERIRLMEYSCKELIMSGSQILNAVRASYRFLLADSGTFTTLWDWSCFLDLLQLLANIAIPEDEELRRNILDLKWCSVQIMSMVLKMNDRAFSKFGLGSGEAFLCLLRWQEFCQDISLEKAGWYLEISAVRILDGKVENLNPYLNHLSNISSEFHGIASPNWSISQGTWASGNPFILTAALKKSFEMVFLATSQRWPVLLYGPAGCGKTALINKLAQDQGSQVLSIHMDEQIDGKTLLGSYVCTEQPGEFRWQPGSLTQAVSSGFWVLFENIDKAPPDVQSILLPLLDGARSFSTGHGEAIRVHEGFRLFSTVTSSKLDISSTVEGKNSLTGLWRRVLIGSPGERDLLNIVTAWYPELDPLAGKLIETFERMNQLAGAPFARTASISSHGRFSLRDLLKWCRRIAGLGLTFVGDGLSSIACNSIYKEAVDVFAAFSTSGENRLNMMKEIARLWTVPIMETLYPVNKPVIQDLRSDLRIGRVILNRTQIGLGHNKKPFVEIRSSVHVLERIACSVKFNEPVLLVGETGAGKTTLVQNLAARIGQKLTVLNLSQQSDVADLLGGFRPIDAQSVLIPLYKEFENLFVSTFSSKDNGEFLARLRKFIVEKNWKVLVSGFQKGVKKIVEIGRCGSGNKRKRPLGEEVMRGWENFSLKLERAHAQINSSSGMIFSFAEGAFVTALKNGEWILLDEVNLAPPEILQRVIGVLEEDKGSLCLAERGDISYIPRHPNFRIFACMNPATDAGKRDLPFSLRSRFTEYFVDDMLDDEDLVLFINQYMDDVHSNSDLVSKIVHFYKVAKKESEERLQDGANQKPQYSLRSLYRALEYTGKARKKFGFQKAFYDGFCMFFLTLLDKPSAKLMNQLILSYLLGGKVPQQVPFDAYLMVRGNACSDPLLESYVLTKSVKEHLSNLARAIFVKRYPVLLQGPTSSGKTSLVQYLATITGHEFVRINNHEHTDLQEYLGSYITDSSGKLVFHEGVLVKAIRNGQWIVLDELNLAPSDVLEALNRLLDDNRELYIPEQREVVRAHPDFMLFATQNPPNIYGGRKMLSRAFRNRFVEIHVDEIPDDELSTILEQRCKIPASYAKKMVDVMKELQLHRQSSKVFAGKQGYITPRDLFRWASRFRVFGSGYEDLAYDGYYLLAERLRDDNERAVVQEVLERQLHVKLAHDEMYKLDAQDREQHIIWTRSMRRLYFLVERCYKLREPVLLVGETGGGKTTVCQLLSVHLHSKLHILNCHQYSETSDFLGGFYPVRERSRIASEFKHLCEDFIRSKAFVNYPEELDISTDIKQASVTLNKISLIINGYRQGAISHPDVTVHELELTENINEDLGELYNKWQTIFIWQDGPLVEAMKKGDLFLVDEISLADDSVLERLNSVLEPERKLSLAEKGGSDLEMITADPNFFLLATMNPGGDFGKKELSPALRNRFTEIWVPSVCDLNELRCIGLERISNPQLTGIVDIMLTFWEWFNHLETGRILTVRDFLSWISFVNVTEESLQPEHALLHGAFLVLLDGLSLGINLSKIEAAKLMKKCVSFLLKQLKSLNHSNLSMLEYYGWSDPDDSPNTVNTENDSMQCDNRFGIHPFYIERGEDNCEATGFEFLAPTTRRNALRVLRAMQLAKPVLLEGSPGVGKTSLIVAIGKFSGHKVVRINLSEQTDIMDLLGSDLPVESDEGVQFAWSDGILLQALKEGSWVLLDELNLAPQSVLEGLNAILDHRAEVFIPELGLTFKCPRSFRVFACQNPSYQGGGRKGLPKSFLNRFTKVYVDELNEGDYVSICTSLYPSIPKSILQKLVLFNKQLYEDTMFHHKFAQDGSPWEFNLRDVIRSCEMIQGAHEKSKSFCFLNTVYVQRMRTSADRIEVVKLYEQIFGLKSYINPFPRVQINPQNLVVGNISIRRNPSQACGFVDNQLKILPGLLNSLEAVADCVRHQWLCILVGPSSSGKTSLIKLLAQLTGNALNEINLSSATDTSELLGCFEQHNAFRNYRIIIAQVEQYMNEYSSLEVESSTEEFFRKKDLLGRWLAFLSSIDYDPTTSSTPTNLETWRAKCFKSIALLAEIIQNLKFDVEKNILPVSWSCMDLERTLVTIRKLQESSLKRQYSAKFEWIPGLLIKAIENGEWIVLENANLCSPTVLDRINSLVEQSGSIIVNECGTVDGKPLVLHPHPQFRMFLTVNPSFGEVSRAMRNRGVEVYMMEPFWLLEKKYNDSVDKAELRDAKRFIVLSGIAYVKLVDMMAKMHIYAKNEGARFDVCITYLELARWVQLFKQLITSGNRPIWSLQVSWEHTYISSLGESEGKEIVAQATSSFLSVGDLSSIEKFQDSLICLPGGWPAPLNTINFVLNSKETCVRRNCMYLEFLGVESASYNFSLSKFSKEQGLIANDSKRIYLMDVRRLYCTMFPSASKDVVANNVVLKQFNSDLAQKMLLFAANWTIEQATESDIELYLCWFSWFGSHLEPFCSFFNYFMGVLKKELKHPVWNQIYRCRRELLCRNSVDLDAFPIPILSSDLVDLSAPCDELKTDAELLMSSIKSVGLVRVSYQQWRSEKQYVHSQRTKHFVPILKALRALEKEVLKLLLVSLSFDVLFRLYNGLLENHMLFWNGIISSHFESIVISWQSLLKSSARIHEFCPREVDNFVKGIKNLDHLFPDSLRSQKSLLWVHGGHPYIPPSGDIYQKQCQLINLCELVWPRMPKFWELSETDIPIEAVLSSNSELRYLAVQGFSMSAYFIGKADEDDFDVIQQLEEMYLLLSRRLEFERHKLEVDITTSKQTFWWADLSVCCSFPPDLLCRRSGFNSWVDVLPIRDYISFLHDMVILRELSRISLLDVEEQHEALSNLTGHMESALNFSMNFSSRPPMDLVPHQKILWAVEAWSSVSTAKAKLASFVLEMWFRWHRFLWLHYPVPPADTSGLYANGILLPPRLFRPLKTETVQQILQNISAIGDCPLYSLKLRVASRDLWRGCPFTADIKDFLLSAARSLFQQIIYSHGKSFEANNYAKIKCFFSSLKNAVTKDDMKAVLSLLGSSNHNIFTSLLDPFIHPLLVGLYIPSAPDNLVFSLGCVWLRIGGLRYLLLTLSSDLDPAIKYSIKYSQLIEKIASLELEMEVRKECVLLAGSFELREADNCREDLLENLNAERKRMQRRIVFRSDPGKFKRLKHELDEFRKRVTDSVSWINNLESMHVEKMIDQVQNWQKTATSFIERLSEEYSGYIDVIQPVQVAIYEMKLGLSLLLSSSLDKTRERIWQQDMDLVQTTVYSFMRFPRIFSSRAVSVKIESWQNKLTSCGVEWPSDMVTLDLKLLENLVAFTGDVNLDSVTSVVHLRTAIYKNILLRVAHFTADVHLLDNASFTLLDKIFGEFASSWMHMKFQMKEKEDDEGQQFKFRPRTFKIENIIELDISTLRSSVAGESFTEWQELLAEEESTEKIKLNQVDETLEEGLNTVDKSILNEIADIHNQFFGSVDLNANPGIGKVSDEDKLSAFIESYSLGVRMIRSLEGMTSSHLDAKLMPEHILRICLEHEQQFLTCHKPGHAYNFYKDSNALMMAKMVEPLANLKQRVLVLLNEWDGHPALQKILDTIEMVLAIPLSTPLAKALSGLQFLLNRVWALQETVAKIPLSDYLKPVFAVVSSFQKLEFESWPALLDDIQVEFEISAGRLWFPLFSVIQRAHSADINEDVESTIHSLDEFIRLSTIGEFKRRLQLLLAFHGQIHSGLCRRSHSSPFEVQILKILYNTFGFYMQFLPNILEHIEANRRNIEKELKDHKKLCWWEHYDDYLSMENSRRARQKLRKIVDKYIELLEQPVAPFLTKGIVTKGVSQSMQGPHLSLAGTFDCSRNLLDHIYNETKLKNEDRRLSWLLDSKKKVDLVLQASQLLKQIKTDFSDVSFKDVEEVTKFIKDNVPFQFMLEKGIWDTIGIVCKTVIDCGDLWKDETKHFGKRRVLSDLLKLLESCGLLKHRSTSMELKTSKSRYWLLQPSYNAQHLLMQGGASNGDVDIVDIAALSNLKSSNSESSECGWKIANKFYFKSIASMHVMQQICLNFHKDFTLEQVKRSNSFLDHLIAILQDQRAAVYGFAEKLQCLRKCVWPLENLFSDFLTDPAGDEWSFIPNQLAIFNCMWQQKHLLDNLSTILCDVRLLVQTVERNHLNSCSNVNDPAKQIFCLIEKFVLEFQTSKDLLDHHLLGDKKVTANAGTLLHPFGVTKQMERLVDGIFQLIKTFEENLSAFGMQARDEGTVKTIILGHFTDVFEKVSVIAEQYNSDLKARDQSTNVADVNLHKANTIGCEVVFHDALKKIYLIISDAFHGMLTLKNGPVSDEETLRNISGWGNLFETDIQCLKLDFLCDELMKITYSAGEVLNHYINTNQSVCSLVRAHLRHLYSLLNVILAFGDDLLHDFLSMHRMVSVMAHVLADVFASLFARGFGIPEDQASDSGNETKQEASGTGMGEGAGINDVSDQIDDEGQLLGSSEKLNGEQDGLSDAPSKNVEGIEMEHDFAADILSVSEESGDDDDDGDNGDEQLEPAMGETGVGGEIAKEKPWNENDDGNPTGTDEKYESGPSVRDNQTNDRELRAKEDPTSIDDAGEKNTEESDKQDEEKGNEVAPDDMEDGRTDKEDTFSDPIGLNLDEPNQGFGEDTDGDGDEKNAEPMEDHETEELQDSAGIENGEEKTDPMDETLEENGEEKTDPMDETLEERGSNHLAEPPKTANQDNDHANDIDMDSVEPELLDGPSQLHTSDLLGDDMPTSQSANSPKVESGAVGLGDAAPETKWSNGGDLQDDLAPMRGLPNSSASELSVTDTLSGRKLGSDHFETRIAPQDLSVPKVQPNPYRSVGDALDGWKQRVKVSVDLEDNNVDAGDLNDENVNEYGYTADFEKGTAQALGPATADQIDKNMCEKDLDNDTGMEGLKENRSIMEIENQPSDVRPIQSSALNRKTDIDIWSEKLDLEKQPEESKEIHRKHDDNTKSSESLVSVKKSYLNEDINQLSKLSVSDSELGKANTLEEISSDVRDNAAILWRRYELLTTRLSQELAEQLRLVMEPTLASRLQGDYRTGKRINMKKVIPYVASHYRKDKIWLRRTRPNKRDYQVVIAVDDSRSMQESHCGNVAIEALVTVCRAMSQLEVGNLAVASFGKKGNIRLLHDFDQPFTGEAGIKMISSLTFKQENTIADEPVVDLLKYLNNMLDAAVANARLPSGHNPLQQLVLIIADGRFHEKENLKRCVRDILSKKRMVAFLLLDSPEESIMDLMEATFEGGNVKFSKYLDSFPFPYYVVLKNIEALPRTLADLLRQWFELMQYSGD